MTSFDGFPAPRENALFFGHESAEKAFETAWRQGRMAHAWLITGPFGIGKATLAYRLARRVLASGTGDGAGLFGEAARDLPHAGSDHPIFPRVARGGHADLMVVERAQAGEGRERTARDITVDQIRDLGHFLRLTPAEGGWRVVIIDTADELNRNAANALLKILEEPPSNVLIFLISNLPGRLLPTIRSRCRRLALSPLPTERIETMIAKLAPEADKDEIATAAWLSGGSPGRALSLMSGNATALWAEIEAIIEDLPSPDPARVEALADRLGRSKDPGEWRQAFELLDNWLIGFIRESAIGGQGGRPDHSAGPRPPGDASGAGLDQWMEVWEKLTRLHRRTEAQNLDRKQAVISAVTLLEAATRSATPTRP